jgi:DNA-directed RNA polymerase subunit alpha
MTFSTLREITLLCHQPIQNDAVYSLFRISPFRKGQALVVASTLRRLLLQEVGAFGLTDITIHHPTHAAHEFTSLGGIQESMPEILKNLRDVKFTVTPQLVERDVPFPTKETSDEVILSFPYGSVSLQQEGRSQLTAGDLRLPPYLHVSNPTLPIATLVSPYARFHMEASLTYSKGYATCIQEGTSRPHGPVRVPLDVHFSPVRRVNYLIKQTRTYEFILFEIWTDGSVTPSAALAEASLAAKHMFQPFL